MKRLRARQPTIDNQHRQLTFGTVHLTALRTEDRRITYLIINVSNFISMPPSLPTGKYCKILKNNYPIATYNQPR